MEDGLQKNPKSFTYPPEKHFPCNMFPAGLIPSGRTMGGRLNHFSLIKYVYLLLNWTKTPDLHPLFPISL